MRKATLFAGLVAGFSTFAFNAAQAVEIEYWQYVFDTRVKAMDQLITEFQKANPGITVKQVTFPYADYQTRVIAAFRTSSRCARADRRVGSACCALWRQ